MDDTTARPGAWCQMLLLVALLLLALLGLRGGLHFLNESVGKHS